MRRRLLLGGIGVVALTLLLFALPLTVVVRDQAVDAGLDSLAGRLEQTATLVDERSRTCGEVQVTLSALAARDLEVAVFDRDGSLRFLAGTDAAAGRVLAAGPEVATAAEGATGRRTAGDRLVVAVPLSTTVCGDRLVLRGTADAEPSAAAADRVTVLLLLAAGAAVVLGGGAAAVLGRRLVAPLEALAASAERLGEGDFSERAPRSGLPEPDAIADALDRTADRLGRAVRRGTDFAADASHQLRTPLTALRLHLDALQAAGTGPPDAIDGAQVEADRLEATVTELVALTRLDEVDEVVDVAALVEQRAEAWRTRAAALGRELEVVVAPVPPLRVRPAAVAQALEVLVDNALTHGRGRVRVVVQPSTPDAPEPVVRLAVADEGAGLPPAAREVLRHRDRGQGGTAAVHGGRGLRLARALVAGEGGRLLVDGEGAPTVLVVLLPVQPDGEPGDDTAP